MPSALLLVDRFERDVRRAAVVGSRASDGARRGGVDVEGVLAVDHGALRIGPLATPGWAREGVAYGPFERRVGRVVVAHLLNGDNMSAIYGIDSMVRRFARWLVGTGSDAVWRRVWAYPRCRPQVHIGRKLRCWWANRGDPTRQQRDNLLVGWFGSQAPETPTAGSGIVVRATDTDGGELTATVSGRLVPAFRGLHNIPVHYVSALRERGAIHFAASAYDGAIGLPAHPRLRPLAIDDDELPTALYAGVHQAALGQIGFSSSTRVYEVSVVDEASWAAWCTSAMVADRLTGPRAPFGRRLAQRGGSWMVFGGDLAVDETGVGAISQEDAPGVTATVPDPTEDSSYAVLLAPEPVGLLHAVVDRPVRNEAVSLLWRWQGPGDHWRVTLVGEECRLEARAGGRLEVCEVGRCRFDGGTQRVQVSDDGGAVSVAVDGEVGARTDRGHAAGTDACGVGFGLTRRGQGPLA